MSSISAIVLMRKNKVLYKIQQGNTIQLNTKWMINEIDALIFR
ncbi:unnamed protein product [Paramecium pentaurelia]|uniref:Uncharacterized protein n=1 Tax=Paramecium pentaurelia TaxID=43138 RepID=A0A8S1XUQ6_9CILI|nr:unnamed protein product [Paramecium pentaurelia]